MYSKVKIFGHPVHPMLVAFPIALYTAALACYIAYNNNADPFWFKAGLAANIALDSPLDSPGFFLSLSND